VGLYLAKILVQRCLPRNLIYSGIRFNEMRWSDWLGLVAVPVLVHSYVSTDSPFEAVCSRSPYQPILIACFYQSRDLVSNQIRSFYNPILTMIIRTILNLAIYQTTTSMGTTSTGKSSGLIVTMARRSGPTRWFTHLPATLTSLSFFVPI
jgi:hypothetical protein